MILALLCRNRQLHIAGRRIHHGRVGLYLIVVGLLACADDILDYPWRTR